MNNFFLSGLLFAVILGNSYFFANEVSSSHDVLINNTLEKYKGKIEHIFFHSLIVYPELAEADVGNSAGYRDWMITARQFKDIIEQLYNNNFILIDSRSLYSFDENGKSKRNALYLPKGKKPLIISLDDLSYYPYMKKGGFANKLVLENDTVKTQVITPEGNRIVTDDGDVVPFLDKFVTEHPDFSLGGAKGIIALTGFQGILGYRTQLKGTRGNREREAVMPVIEALKNSGWIFASHSFSHSRSFLDDDVLFARDIYKWKTQVEPLVGATNIFVGPFGEVFQEGDERRQKLIDSGFNVLYGVGMDGYMKFFDDHFVMNRVNIDGYRLFNSPKKLYKLFGISVE